MSGPEMSFPYLADDALAAVFREYWPARQAYPGQVRSAWEQRKATDPDALQPVVVKGYLSYDLRLAGFFDPQQDQRIVARRDKPPAGLRRQSRGDILIPYASKPGQRWRDELASYPQPPRVTAKLRDDFGIRDQVVPSDRYDRDGTEWMVLPTIRPVGDQVFVVCAAEHPENPHLTRVPLSQYYAAVEAAGMDR